MPSQCQPSSYATHKVILILKQVQHDIMIGTLALKNPNEFGISLTYSYLCQHEKDDSYLLRVLCGALFQGSDVPAMCA